MRLEEPMVEKKQKEEVNHDDRSIFVVWAILALISASLSCNAPFYRDNVSPLPATIPAATTAPIPAAEHSKTLDIASFGEPTNWQYVGAPPSNTVKDTLRILLDPEDDDLWYVISKGDGLYITRDGGISWELALPLDVSIPYDGIAIDPENPKTLYVADYDKTLYITNDKGLTWRALHSFASAPGAAGNELAYMAILVSSFDGSIYVAFGGQTNSNPGVYRSVDQGSTWSFHPFGISQPHLITWEIEEDPKTGTLFVSTEIGDHPKPYHPPFFRSTDGGTTWEDITGILPWHVIQIQVDSKNDFVYALTEGPGLFRASIQGNNWQFLSNNFASELLIDPRFPGLVFGGQIYSTTHEIYGGAFFSDDGGQNFHPIGLSDISVGSLAFNSSGSKLFAAGYEYGIYVKNIEPGH